MPVFSNGSLKCFLNFLMFFKQATTQMQKQMMHEESLDPMLEDVPYLDLIPFTWFLQLIYCHREIGKST